MDIPVGKSTLGEMLPLFIIIAILLLFLIFCVKMLLLSLKMQKEKKNQLKNEKSSGATLSATFLHTNGLPIAENIPCKIISYPDRLTITANQNQFNLEKSKVTDICIKTETEIQKQYVSSIGGAVGGAILFGPLGAMIGGRAKEKRAKTDKRYLIITYKKDDGLQFIGFDVTQSYYIAAKFVGEFMQQNGGEKTIVDL